MNDSRQHLAITRKRQLLRVRRSNFTVRTAEGALSHKFEGAARPGRLQSGFALAHLHRTFAAVKIVSSRTCWGTPTAATHTAATTTATSGGLTAFNLLVDRNSLVVLCNRPGHFVSTLKALGKTLALGFVQAPTTGKARLLGAGGHDQKHESRRQSSDPKQFSHEKSSV